MLTQKDERTIRQCCFCGKRNTGLLFACEYIYIICREPYCNPSYRWVMRYPSNNLKVFEIVPYKEYEEIE